MAGEIAMAYPQKGDCSMKALLPEIPLVVSMNAFITGNPFQTSLIYAKTEENMNRDQAVSLLKEWTKTDGLLLHAAVVENAMRHYARVWGEDENEYGITGLLHDLDYEKYPDTDHHPYEGVKILRSLGVDEIICLAILGHASYTHTPRETLLAKTLYAVDELSGFITAVCYVTYPNKPKVKSVRKKLKEKSFAAKVDRDEIFHGMEELGVDPDVHIERVTEAVWEVFVKMKENSGFLDNPPSGT